MFSQLSCFYHARRLAAEVRVFTWQAAAQATATGLVGSSESPASVQWKQGLQRETRQNLGCSPLNLTVLKKDSIGGYWNPYMKDC